MIDPMDADVIVAAFTDALATGADPVKTLREWSLKHPELEADFAAVAVEQYVGEGDVDAVAVNAQADMMSRMLAEMGASRRAHPTESVSAVEPVRASSIKDAAESRGLAYPAELARRLRLPENILERIVSRRIDAATLPIAVVQQLAAVLHATREDVLNWLLGPLAGTAGTPALVREKSNPYNISTSFADSISSASGLDDADRAYWQSILRVSRAVADEE
jgi:hypothetical protein